MFNDPRLEQRTGSTGMAAAESDATEAAAQKVERWVAVLPVVRTRLPAPSFGTPWPLTTQRLTHFVDTNCGTAVAVKQSPPEEDRACRLRLLENGCVRCRGRATQHPTRCACTLRMLGSILKKNTSTCSALQWWRLPAFHRREVCDLELFGRNRGTIAAAICADRFRCSLYLGACGALLPEFPPNIIFASKPLQTVLDS
jgi:hypothetical protein